MDSALVFCGRPKPSAVVQPIFGRLTAQALSGLDSGFTLFLNRGHKPTITIRPDPSAPRTVERSEPGSGGVDSDARSSEPAAASTVCDSQEEPLDERSVQQSSSLRRAAVNAETGAHSAGQHIQHPPSTSLSVAEAPVGSAMFGPVKSEVSSVHRGDASGNRPDRPDASSDASSASPQSPARTAEDTCPDEKVVSEVEDSVMRESSTDHGPSPSCDTIRTTSSLSEGNSSVAETLQLESECRVDQPVSILPSSRQALTDADVENPGERVSLEPTPAVLKASPQRQELRATQESCHQGSSRLLSEDPPAKADPEDTDDTLPEIPVAVAPETAPPSSPPPEPQRVCAHQEDIMGAETHDLQKRAEVLVFDLIRVSGARLSAAFRYKVGKNLVAFAQTSKEACRLVRETMDREMVLLLRYGERGEVKLKDINKFRRRFVPIFWDLEPRRIPWTYEDPDDPQRNVPPPPAPRPAPLNPEEDPVEGLHPPAHLAAPQDPEEDPVQGLRPPAHRAAPQDPEEYPMGVPPSPTHRPAPQDPEDNQMVAAPSPAHRPDPQDPEDDPMLVPPSPAHPAAPQDAEADPVEGLPSPTQRVDPQAQTPSCKRRACAISQQNNTDTEEMEAIRKRPRLCLKDHGSVAQHPSPHVRPSPAQHVAPQASSPRKRCAPTSQQNSTDTAEEMETKQKRPRLCVRAHSSVAQHLSPHVWPSPAQHVAPQAPSSHKRRAPTAQQNNTETVEEMEKKPKRPRLCVTDHSSVAQHSSDQVWPSPADRVAPQAPPPHRRHVVLLPHSRR